ncbi:cell wall metabolism sensor histidine kinase WalK [Actinomadura sp. WMMB 499]|uniref:sensor histidine kinase n=1 Tax=Actinomadura sp. WMMB 499 TaxID=1219491 RepID=UPI0012487EDB|nr:PAS domain-containing sensor histidine kinase [Actinomadura sp. WMMB 499]QFG23945.1 PAS domain-containing protein [Actinomadura sp. WMMB 499]
MATMVDIDMAEVFEAMPTPCVLLSPDLRILAMNRAFERMLGLRDRLLGRDLFEAFPGGPDGPNAQSIRPFFERIVAEGEPDILPLTRYDIEDPDRPGHYEVRYWDVITTPLLDRDGRVELLIHRLEDITVFIEHLHRGTLPASPSAGQKAAEAELFVHAQELREVNQRLRDVQVQDRRAAAALQEIVQRQQQEVAVSHDLRNPLAGLQTRLEAALAEPDVDSREVLNAALQDAEWLSEIVADLLELARLDGGEPLAAEPVDLTEVVRETLARQSCRCAVAVHVDRPAVVRGSRSRLVRLLGNLLANADRHARTDVEVSLGTDRDEAVVRVIDDGPGIPAEEREAVFRRFYRGAGARRADPGGTGLGLSIARQTARAHHGTLDIADSPAGTGTCMVLRIPLATG